MSPRRAFLAVVPDEPPCIDLRGLLLEGAECVGVPGGFVAVGRGGRLLAAAGRPTREAVAAAIARAERPATLLASGEALDVVAAVCGSPGELAIIHQVGERGLLRPPDLPPAVLLERGAPVDAFEGEVRRELEEFLGVRPVAAVVERGRPVAVCYPTVMTETCWDVSIDTHADFRRGGRATAAFFRAVEAMSESGLEPVWGAVESNAASRALAAKLGFVSAGELRVFELPAPTA